jgi:aminoglycoside phosphotransferase (APT) family kinase protein
MHDDEVATDASLVRGLLAAQFPEWADLPIERVASDGTDNAIYRLGDDMAVRLPRIHWAAHIVEKEHRWLPRLAPHLPLAIPTPLVMGMPGEGYPWRWSVYRWLEGEPARIDRLADPVGAANGLARFILALQSIDASGRPLAMDHNLRGVTLAMRDSQTRAAIAAMEGIADTGTLTEIWEEALQVPEWACRPVWFHGDMLSGNVLLKDGRVSAVIDFGGLGVGDPACDLMIAWGLFSGESRDAFRSALAVDDATWARGRGRALSQAVIFIPYYRDTNPVGVARARRALDEIIDEHRRGA